MKRLIVALAALAITAGGGGVTGGTAVAAEVPCCWKYCEVIRTGCKIAFPNDRDLCDSWFEGCIYGCQYPGPSGGSGGGGGEAY